MNRKINEREGFSDLHPSSTYGMMVAMRRLFAAGVLYIALFGIVGCSQQSEDKEIKADITTKAKTDVNFPGVEYTVADGVVTLTGTCPTEKSKSEVEKTIKSINIIKGINNEIKIGPVVLNDDFPLKQSVDSTLAAYPTVQATVSQHVVTLTGKTQKQEADQLLPAINKLHPEKWRTN